MGKLIILLIVAIFVVGLVLGFAASNFVFTGEVVGDVSDDYTYTTAICNLDNDCIDVLVSCSNGGVAGLEPVSELVEFGEEWEDAREKEGFCS